MNLEALELLVSQKYINVQKHPNAELFLYNYTQNTQYESLWNEYTLMCRGLILDAKGEIVARPFTKFFNWEEHKNHEIPAEPFEVFEKMDGSLGILYWANDKPSIATRGSFTSEQAIWATTFLHQHFEPIFSSLNRNCTYLFEIIYPSNRIVVDYASKQDLVLLAVIETSTGKDLDLPQDLGFTCVKKYDGLTDYQSLKLFQKDNFEGFVLKFQSGFRVKVKLEEYIRLHRIITNMSNVDIWKCLAEGRSFDEFLENVPDEFYQWVKATKVDLENKFKEIEALCKANFKVSEDRRTTAEYMSAQPYSPVLFKMLDDRPYDYIIWRLIRPTFQKAFKAVQS